MIKQSALIVFGLLTCVGCGAEYQYNSHFSDVRDAFQKGCNTLQDCQDQARSIRQLYNECEEMNRNDCQDVTDMQSQADKMVDAMMPATYTPPHSNDNTSSVPDNCRIQVGSGSCVDKCDQEYADCTSEYHTEGPTWMICGQQVAACRKRCGC